MKKLCSCSTALLVSFGLTAIGSGQPIASQPIVTLEVEVEGTAYIADSTDFTKIARTQELTRPDAPPPNFYSGVLIYDIVRVNGRPARGTHTMTIVQTRTSPTPASGTAIADTTRSSLAMGEIEIQDENGRDVGMLSLQGYFGGPLPPGAPLAPPGTTSRGSHFTVVGGSGAFFGARGQASQTSLTPGPGGRPPASLREDPALRRTFGNQGSYTYFIQIIPQAAPLVEEVLHADLTPVTPMRPAQTGEGLILRVKGMAPMEGVALGEVAPEVPVAIVPPVEVRLNGQAAPVLNKVGWPGTADRYRVDFRVPAGLSGAVDVKLTVGWIPAEAVRVSVQ